ncbi:MAG: hypothetical protein KAT91_00670 [Candidatus Aenigmarchaeota archaeon]|nr:hypothetical protein [Candidatus Aenigmarchaeota archaeon]
MGNFNFNIWGVFLWAMLGILVSISFLNIADFFSLDYKRAIILLGGFSTGLAVILMKLRNNNQKAFLLAIASIILICAISMLGFYATQMIQNISLGVADAFISILLGVIVAIAYLFLIQKKTEISGHKD